MIIDLTRLTANTQTWAQNPSTADVSVTLNGTARTLSGMDAAAYLFGQALTTIKFQGTLDGVQLTDGRFEFPPASGQWVSLGEVADALRYKYGVDPLIEFAPGLGVRGYSVADINRILEALNREFADQFSLTLLSSAAVIGATQATVDAEIAAGNTAFYAPVISYLTDLSTKATALRDFYTARRDDANVRAAGYLTMINSGQTDVSAQVFTSGRSNALASATNYQNYLTEINIRLGMIAALKTSASNGGADFNTVLSGYRTASITDVFAELKKCDVDPSLLWNAPQSFVTCTLPNKFSGAPEIMAAYLDWTQPTFGLVGSVQLFESSDDSLRAAVYSAASAGERNGAFGEFDWEKWKAGNEVFRTNLGATSNLWDFSIISPNLSYPSPNGYTDAVFAGFAAGFTSAANATDTVAESITFTNDPGWNTGMPVRVSTTGGGLDAGTDYFVRNLTGGKYAFFSTQAAATGTGITGRKDLTANITATVSPSPAIATTATDTDTTGDTITFFNDPGWATGLPVRVSTTGGGLDAGTDYFVRNLTGGKYAFFNDQAAAGAGTTGRVNLTADISTTVSPRSGVISGNATDAANDTIAFLNDPGWTTGMRVQVSATGGGLDAGTDYFVRNLTGGKYAFFNDPAAATAGTGIAGRVPLTSDISSTVTPRPGVITGGATDTPNDTITFLSDPGWVTGLPVQVSTTGGGLDAGTDYFVRNLTGGKYAFFSTQAAASGTDSTGRKDLTANIAATVSPSPTLATTATDIDTTAETITFLNDPGWVTGLPVQVSATGSGLEAGKDYFVRNLSGGKYAVFTTQAATLGPGTAGRVNLTAGASVTLSPSLPSATVQKDWVAMSIDPNWATGTPVQVSATGGGLTALVDYFVRSLGSGRYEFFTSQAAAAAGTATNGRVPLTGSVLAATISPQPTSATVQNDWVTFATNPNWATGTPVRVSATGGGLTAGVDYFVRNLGDGRYEFFKNLAAAAAGPATSDRVPLTGSVLSATITPYPSSATVDGDWATFSINPTWTTGTLVRVRTTGGGLTAGVDYFVRNLTGGYAFFTDLAAASGTGTAGRVNLTAGASITLVSPQYSNPALFAQMDAISTPILAKATETELRQNLTAGGDLYNDRFGAFYLNGVRTQAMDVAVTSRLLVQDNVSSEYKTLMDELAERNNLIAAARSAVAQIDLAASKPIAEQRTALAANLASLSQLYGYDDILLDKLTAGKISGLQFPELSDVMDYLKGFSNNLPDFYGRLDIVKNTTQQYINDFDITIADYDSRIAPLEQQLASATAARDGLNPNSPTYNQTYNFISLNIQTLEGQLYPLQRDKAQAVYDRSRYLAIAAANLEQQRVAGLTLFAMYDIRGLSGSTSNPPPANFDELLARLATWKTSHQADLDAVGLSDPLEYFHLNYLASDFDYANDTSLDASGQWVTEWDQWLAQKGDQTDTAARAYSTAAFKALPAYVRRDGALQSIANLDATGLSELKALLNTLISNKVRDGDLDQAKLQTLTAQLQNNTEAMTAMIKAFSDMNSALAQALR